MAGLAVSVVLLQPPMWASFSLVTEGVSSWVPRLFICSIPPGGLLPVPGSVLLPPVGFVRRHSPFADTVCSIVRTKSTEFFYFCLMKRTFFDIKKSRRTKTARNGASTSP